MTNLCDNVNLFAYLWQRRTWRTWEWELKYANTKTFDRLYLILSYLNAQEYHHFDHTNRICLHFSLVSMQWQPKWYPFWVSMVSLFAGWHVMASLPINPNGTVQQLSKQLRYAINVKECKDLNLFKPKNVIFCPWGYVKKLWKHKIRHIYE